MQNQSPDEQVKYISIYQPGLDNLFMWASDVYQWVYSNFVIHVPPKINTNVVTAFPPPKGEVPITVYPSINESARLVSFCSSFVAQLRTIYHGLFQLYKCCRY